MMDLLKQQNDRDEGNKKQQQKSLIFIYIYSTYKYPTRVYRLIK